MQKKKSCRLLGNKTPDRNHPARFMSWEKASEQRRKFCCGAHWVKKGERPINRLGHREEEQWAAGRGAPTAAEPHIPTHTPTHTLIHTNSLFSPAHTPAGTSERGPAKQMLGHWLHKEHKWRVEGRKKGKHPYFFSRSVESAFRTTLRQALMFVAHFSFDCQHVLSSMHKFFSVTRPDLFQINEITFVICTSFARWEPWRRMWIQEVCWGESYHSKISSPTQ